MSKRGFRSKDEAFLVKELEGRGWRRARRNGMNHLQMVWPQNNQVLSLPGAIASKSLIAKIRKRARIAEVKTPYVDKPED